MQMDFVRGVVDKLVAGGEAGEGGPAVLVLDAGQGGVLAVGGDAGGVGLGFGQGREGQVLRERGGNWEKARGKGREDGGLEMLSLFERRAGPTATRVRAHMPTENQTNTDSHTKLRNNHSPTQPTKTK